MSHWLQDDLEEEDWELVEALIEEGLADDVYDAIAQLEDMGELD